MTQLEKQMINLEDGCDTKLSAMTQVLNSTEESVHRFKIDSKKLKAERDYYRTQFTQAKDHIEAMRKEMFK
eukprot:CAMPEP_0170507466 /NCGR_PEP_ID=MMETSP0208-20121228/58947_1 /TAXON_ID=197538 /ORGANISM="Strombidium inclinatum, Strain S3" /LENGTH=70 /DNA_ID=CAMNT_0010789669 /DNA_START=166 /DNA_END=378 /DNA_ORIENTATION=+